MGKLYDEYLKLLTTELEKDVKRILQECVDERDYQHDTMNLYDSYGYGIYVQGKLSRTGYLSATPQAEKGKKWYGEEIHGREAIKAYLNKSHKAVGAIDVAVVAAMPYAKVLEAGGGGIKKKYKVISMSFQKLQAIASKYNGTVRLIRQ